MSEEITRLKARLKLEEALDNARRNFYKGKTEGKKCPECGQNLAPVISNLSSHQLYQCLNDECLVDYICYWKKEAK